MAVPEYAFPDLSSHDVSIPFAGVFPVPYGSAPSSQSWRPVRGNVGLLALVIPIGNTFDVPHFK